MRDVHSEHAAVPVLVALYEHSKRILDASAALIGILLIWPLLAVVALLIRLDSPGPVFYRGVRTGRYGRPFRILKFRSMVVDADKGPGSTAQNDARITRVGRIIRRYKIDELPQLANVLLGDMSLVGPRPELPRYTERYVGDELQILSVRPGITDYSSLYFIQLGDVLGAEDPDGVFEQEVLPVKNQLRVQYVRDRSFILDLRLIFRTLFRIGKRQWSTPGSGRAASRSAD